MAWHYWCIESSLGHQISIDNGSIWLTIIGVVPDSRKSLDAEVEDSFYVPLDQIPVARTILIRTTGNPAKIGQLVRAAVYSIDPEQPLDSLRTLEEVRSDSISSPRLTMTLLSLFAGLALLITATGIGGVIGFFVNQRRHEIGIRMALGAEHGSVLWLVLREGMMLISLGILFGFAGAFGLGRLMTGLLFRIRATDPATFIGAAFVVVVVAASACLVPAYRATTIDPTTALRSE